MSTTQLRRSAQATTKTPLYPSVFVGAVAILAGVLGAALLASGLLAAVIGLAAGALALLLLRVTRVPAGGLPGLAVAAIVLVPVAFPSLMSVENATIAAALGIIAVSQYLITGVAGQMSLGQGAFAAIGAYGFAVAFDMGLPWPLALAIGVLLAAAIGVVIGLVALRLKELYLAMVTLALVVALPPIIKLDGISALTGGANGLILGSAWTPGVDLLGTSLSHYLVVVTFLVIVMMGISSIATSRHGLAIRALEFSEVSARASGVPLFGYRMTSFLLSSAVAGLGGGLYIMVIGIVTPESFSLAFSLQFMMMIVLGGMRRLGGAVVGAALVWWLHLNLEGFTLPIGAAGFDILPGAVFAVAVIIVVLFFPEGVAGGTARVWGWLRRVVARWTQRSSVPGRT